MISTRLKPLALALPCALATPALAVTAPGVTPPTAAQVDEAGENEYDFDDDEVDVQDGLVTEEDIEDETEIADSTLATEQEADDVVTVEPKDDGQDVIQAAEEYLSKTEAKEAEVAEAAPAPRSTMAEVSIPDGTVATVAEAKPEKEPNAETKTVADALVVKPQVVKNTAFIVKLQQALVAQGAKIDVDGQMGKKTQQALLDYQKKAGIEADGLASAATLEKLGL